MVAVLLLAAYLRIHDLNAQGMWGDEGWSIWLARGDTIRDLTMTMVADHHGPVYSILLRAWELVVGETVRRAAHVHRAVLRSPVSPCSTTWAAKCSILLPESARRWPSR